MLRLKERALEGKFWSAAPVVLFAVLATAPFFWISADTAYRFMGADDYLSPIDVANSLRYSIYPFDHVHGAGLEQAFLVAMTPVYAFYYVMDAFGSTPLLSTVLLVAILTFTAQTSFFVSLRYFLRKADFVGGNGAATLGAIFYGFSPYMAAQILPGHCMTLVVYCVFPLVIRYLDELLVEERLSAHAALALFILFAAASPSLGNIGLLYVLLIAGGVYALSVLATQGLPLWRVIVRTLLFALLPFFANGWWIAAHLYNLPSYMARSLTYGGEMVNLVAYASKDASVANILQGRPESTIYLVDLLGTSLYLTAFQRAAFLALTAFAIWGALSRKRGVYAMLFAALVTLMFMKGVQAPFADLFLWAYDHVPGFQVMRRPVAKMYGSFHFFFMACATFGMAVAASRLTSAKWVSRGAFGFVATAAGYAVLSFSSISGMKPFNIPEMYFAARDYLLKDHLERALVLPAITDVRPVYRAAMNSYSGMDFVSELWRFPKIFANTFDLSSDAGYLRPTKLLLEQLRDGRPFCDSVRELGLSHLIVRDDMSASVEEYPARVLARNLSNRAELLPRKTFGDWNGARLSIFRIKDECAGRLIELRGTYKSFNYEMLNPGLIALSINGLSGPAELVLRTEYTNNWDLLTGARAQSQLGGLPQSRGTITAAHYEQIAKPMDFAEIRYLFSSSRFSASHRPDGFANAWTILPESNPDAGNLTLTLYYRPQGIQLVGTMASLLVALLLVSATVYAAVRRRRAGSELGAVIP